MDSIIVVTYAVEAQKLCAKKPLEYIVTVVNHTVQYARKLHAQAPISAIQKAPPNTKHMAITRLVPRSDCQLSSLRKSSDSKSTRLVYVSRPAEMAFMVPTTISPVSELGSYRFRVAIPKA